MSNQPYEGYDPHQQQGEPYRQGWYDQNAAAGQDPQQYTQQWQGQTWGTQAASAPPAAADTAHLSAPGYEWPGADPGYPAPGTGGPAHPSSPAGRLPKAGATAPLPTGLPRSPAIPGSPTPSGPGSKGGR